MIRPLIKLLMHEFQEYLHLPPDINLDQVFYLVCELQTQKLQVQTQAIDEKR